MKLSEATSTRPSGDALAGVEVKMRPVRSLWDAAGDEGPDVRAGDTGLRDWIRSPLVLGFLPFTVTAVHVSEIPAMYWFRKPETSALAAAAILSLSLAALLATLAFLLWHGHPRLLAALWVLPTFAPAAVLVANHFPFFASQIGPRTLPSLEAAIGIIGLLLAFRGGRTSLRLFHHATAILSLAVLLVWARALYMLIWVATPAALAELPNWRPNQLITPAHRVVWIVFDELSQKVLEQQLGHGSLPGFRHLLDESIAATAARSPANSTKVSVPALISGQTVQHAVEAGPRLLWLTLADGQGGSWTALGTIFSWARAHQYAASIVGWYHPYGKLFGADTVRTVSADPAPAPYKTLSDERAGLAGSVRNEFRVLAGSIPFSTQMRLIDFSAIVRQREAEYLASLEGAAAQEAANPSRALVFLHLPLPHPPGIYDSTLKRVDTRRPHSYLESLDQMDRLLTTIRDTMEATGASRNTVLIVSSDHTLRTAGWRNREGWYEPDNAIPVDDRVPFVVHFPGAHALGIEFHRDLHTIVSRALIEQLLTGEVQSENDALAWLNTHATAEHQTEGNNVR